MFITVELLKKWLEKFCELLEQETDLLTQLDQAIGDADHGISMQRGARAICTAIHNQTFKSPEQLLMTVNRAIGEASAGAGGSFYAAFFKGTASATVGHPTLDTTQFASAINAGVQALQELGKAESADKTMYDAAKPGADTFLELIDAGAHFNDACMKARKAANQGKEATYPLRAKKGRAAFIGERSRNHIDPGAASMALLFDALTAMLQE
jgi:phosphoenolpyruvate---glycerone phosphotransferase subunit DhaL